MPDVTHLSPQQQRIFDLLKRADKLIGDMMPGVRHIALPSYAELNNVPLDIYKMLGELSVPSTTDWTQERITEHNNGTCPCPECMAYRQRQVENME